jgi:large subunit ribosomal protein L24
MVKLLLRKGDRVQVITGKDKGKKGKILYALPDKSKVVVEGLNKAKRHIKPTPKNPQAGGIIEKELSIHVSNVMLVCPSCGQPTRLGHQRDKEGKRIRICKKCGANVDKK